ncbi:hypothetical protein XM38_043100 [Halomicronema hongdechloris C2206]|uniref:Uncharacterized protein n=1 Tax=Halomicronema hongdechloris C2206 TaxID=1641165 RepID=A0A1V8NDX5_9CYAN|nr:hypothetical protein [Halomicronema hongdechloris]ASC73345.1 hypothetical protein XM38_043100 [Halomicronema hongdechloris C2206]
MRSPKTHKIDLNADYPCPCRRRGRLKPIALTDAFGCDRCQQIFVVRDDGYAIEQLSTHYPYKRAWRWTGHQWRLDRATSNSYLPVLLVVLFGVMVFILLLATLHPPTGTSMVVRLIAALLISLLLVFMFWLASRR